MRKKVFILFSIIIVMVVGGVFMTYNRVQNVFDEIYHTWDRNLFVQTNFTNVPALKENRIQGYVYPGDNEITNVLKLKFDDSFINENMSVRLSIYPTDKKIKASCFVYYDSTKTLPVSEGRGEGLLISFYYEEKTKMLTIVPVRAFSDILAERSSKKYEKYEYYGDNNYISDFMEEHDISKVQIENYKEYFMNDVLIGMWLDGNAKESRFTRNNVGDYTIQDNLFKNLSE